MRSNPWPEILLIAVSCVMLLALLPALALTYSGTFVALGGMFLLVSVLVFSVLTCLAAILVTCFTRKPLGIGAIVVSLIPLCVSAVLVWRIAVRLQSL